MFPSLLGVPQLPIGKAYVGSWLAVLREDKHELFRAARDAHKAADLLIELEHHKSLDQALAPINKPQSSLDRYATSADDHVHDSTMVLSEPAMEMELTNEMWG